MKLSIKPLIFTQFSKIKHVFTRIREGITQHSIIVDLSIYLSILGIILLDIYNVKTSNYFYILDIFC